MTLRYLRILRRGTGKLDRLDLRLLLLDEAGFAMKTAKTTDEKESVP
jgi:hypothetical protein